MPAFASLDWYLKTAETVRAIYLEELYREPEPGGLYNWLFHAREEQQNAAWIRARIQETPEWHAIHDIPPAAPFKPAPRFWRGNMCGVRVQGLPSVSGGAADPTLVLSWFYDRYTPENRAKIREAWAARDYTHVLLSWPDSRAFGQTPLQFLGTCQELIAEGFYPCVMLTSKDHDPANVPVLVDALTPILGLLVGIVPMFCIGWELSLWLSPTQVQQLIDGMAPQCLKQRGTLVYVHFQQGYMSFQQPGQFVADFWKLQVGKLTGVLRQKILVQTPEEYRTASGGIVDVLQRMAGNFGMPADSGFGHPFDDVELEISAQDQFNRTMTEAQGDALGRWAIETPAQSGPAGRVWVMGSGNGL